MILGGDGTEVKSIQLARTPQNSSAPKVTASKANKLPSYAANMYVTMGIIDIIMMSSEPKTPVPTNPPPDAVAASVMNSPPVSHTPSNIAAPTHLKSRFTPNLRATT